MSGGTFDLSHFELTDFSEDLLDWLEKHKDEVPPLVRARLINLANQAAKMAPLVKVADYYASGDYGDDTFNEAWTEAQNA